MSTGQDRFNISPQIIVGVLRFADLGIIIMAALLAHFVRYQDVVGTTLEKASGLNLPGKYILFVLAVVIITANVFHFFRLYEFRKLTGHFFQIRKLFVGWTLVVLLLVAVGFLSKTSAEYSRIWVTLWFTFAFVGLSVLRFCVKLIVAHWQSEGRLTRKIAVVGAGPQGQRIIKFLTSEHDPSLELVGIFDDRRSRVPAEVHGHKVLGNLDKLLQAARAGEVDEIVVALPWQAEDRLLEILLKLKTVPVDVRLCPEGVAFQFPNRPFSQLRGVSMLSVFERPLSPWDRVIKGFEDRILAALILVFISPLLLCLTILIKLDSPGPVFFRQKRFGFNNKVIDVYKFRTMYHREAIEVGVPQARRGDPRVTALGRFLRHTSLDELPQFINVVGGEMSIVGPRPHAVAHNEKFAAVLNEYLARHNVKPGITGWAQINGYRGEITGNEDLEKRIQYDLYYIDNWSLLFDLRIMLLTVVYGFLHNKAY